MTEIALYAGFVTSAIAMGVFVGFLIGKARLGELETVRNRNEV